MPRTLLVIDEFQELFVDDDKVSQDASLLLDRLVRQGRAFGMHVLLGSQTLGGLIRSTDRRWARWACGSPSRATNRIRC